MSRRIYLHIGAPKTGTTYLQDMLTINAKPLAEHDVHLPNRHALTTPELFHFRAALDLLDQDWGGPEGHAAGSWDALVRRVRRRTGTVIVSHEILAPAGPERIAKAKRDLLGDSRESELHVVYTVRDLARQLPAAWQESIKQGSTWSYRKFLRRARRRRPWLARAIDLPQVLTNWGAGLPPERVHVVTAPHRRDPDRPDELWRRFATACGFDPAWAPHRSQQVNQSLGIAETQVIRQLNRRLEESVRREPRYDRLVRELLAQTALAGREGHPMTLPPRMMPWVEQEAQRWIDWIQESGVQVVGDLEELRPRPLDPADPSVSGPGWRDPDLVRPRQQLGAALDALAAMTQEAARRPDPDQQLVRKARSQARRLRDQ